MCILEQCFIRPVKFNMAAAAILNFDKKPYLQTESACMTVLLCLSVCHVTLVMLSRIYAQKKISTQTAAN